MLNNLLKGGLKFIICSGSSVICWRHNILWNEEIIENLKNWWKPPYVLNNLRNFNEIFRIDVVYIKSHKKHGFTLSLSLSLSLSLKNKNLDKLTTTVKIWSKRKLLEIPGFPILGIRWNNKLRNFESFFFPS